jgi:tRNA pseudouridine13 synthase
MIDRGAHVRPKIFLTGDIPGIGGRIKTRPEDFLVDEIPLYDPSGEGEHIYLYVEKRNLAAMELIGLIARHFGVRRDAIGYAGLKDKQAITRQVISVHAPGKSAEDFPSIKHENIAVLWSDQHTNKLRRGHLKGNRFSIRVREVSPTGVLVAKKVLDRLEKSGVPNRFGEQRFGFLGNNHLVGAALIKGDFETATRELFAPAEPPDVAHARAKEHFLAGRFDDAQGFFPPQARTERSVLSSLAAGKKPKQAWYTLPSEVRVFYLNAWQSAVFNAVLDQRLEAGTLATLVEGDLAMKHENRAVFPVDRAVLEDPSTAARLAGLEISATGPMWGPSMIRASGPTDAIEVSALEATGVTLDDLRRFATAGATPLEGARRPVRVPLMYPDVEGGVDEHGPYVRAGFELPRGAFATVVLREIMKPEAVIEAEESGE